MAESNLTVRAIEPNSSMRLYGKKNVAHPEVIWSNGVAENTGLQSNTVHGAFFGSSFNVVNQNKALAEAARIVVPNGWFACLWNHRELDDPLQQRIEKIINEHSGELQFKKNDGVGSAAAILWRRE